MTHVHDSQQSWNSVWIPAPPVCGAGGGGGHGDKETQGKVAEEARQSAQTGGGRLCVGVCSVPLTPARSQ